MVRRLSTLATLAAGLAACGCGGSYHKVNGVVKLDGAPVAGATVTFVSEDGNKTYNGFTDDSGAFSLTGEGSKTGAPAGTYKVTVTKAAPLAGDGTIMNPTDPAYMKQMQKEAKEANKGTTGPPVSNPMMMKPGMGGKMPMGPMPGGPPASAKSLLPAQYASATSTPLTVKIPAESDPVIIELKK